MAKLILSMDGLVLKEIHLGKERITIGRKPYNDIQIDNLAISGEHAVIVTVLDDSFLEDLNSTNGTSVNGQPIKKHFLQDGDVIELGKYKLKYFAEPVQQDDLPDFEKTMALHLDDAKVVTTSATPAAPGAYDKKAENLPKAEESPPVAPSITETGVVQILSGANSGRELELTKTLTSLGKPGAQVAVITKRSQGYFITHVEGSQFPVLNGQALDAQAHKLNDHDIIEIAGVKMEFFLKK